MKIFNLKNKKLICLLLASFISIQPISAVNFSNLFNLFIKKNTSENLSNNSSNKIDKDSSIIKKINNKAIFKSSLIGLSLIAIFATILIIGKKKIERNRREQQRREQQRQEQQRQEQTRQEQQRQEQQRREQQRQEQQRQEQTIREIETQLEQKIIKYENILENTEKEQKKQNTIPSEQISTEKELLNKKMEVEKEILEKKTKLEIKIQKQESLYLKKELEKTNTEKINLEAYTKQEISILEDEISELYNKKNNTEKEVSKIKNNHFDFDNFFSNKTNNFFNDSEFVDNSNKFFNDSEFFDESNKFFNNSNFFKRSNKFFNDIQSKRKQNEKHIEEKTLLIEELSKKEQEKQKILSDKKSKLKEIIKERSIIEEKMQKRINLEKIIKKLSSIEIQKLSQKLEQIKKELNLIEQEKINKLSIEKLNSEQPWLMIDKKEVERLEELQSLNQRQDEEDKKIEKQEQEFIKEKEQKKQQLKQIEKDNEKIIEEDNEIEKSRQEQDNMRKQMAQEQETLNKEEKEKYKQSKIKYIGKDKIEDIYSQDQCLICLEEFNKETENLIKLPCGHIFHLECLSEWLLSKDEQLLFYKDLCPCCRKKISEDLAEESLLKLLSKKSNDKEFNKKLLFYASTKASLNILNKILNKGKIVDINSKIDGRIGKKLSSTNGELTNIEEITESDWTPLHFVAFYSDPNNSDDLEKRKKIINILIKNGANPEAKSSFNNRPINVTLNPKLREYLNNLNSNDQGNSNFFSFVHNF